MLKLPELLIYILKMSKRGFRLPKKTKELNILKKKDYDEYVILTLKDEKKLVVSSDGYHTIVKTEKSYSCMVCETDMVLEDRYKAEHINLQDHLQTLGMFPHIEKFNENLIRQISNIICYCSLCNTVVSTTFLMRHIEGELHKQELEKASNRSAVYKPKTL